IGGIWLFRRPITISLIERVNENIPGTIFIGDGNLNWDHFFTRLSLRLDDTVLADKNGSELLRAGEISFEVNPAALLLGKIDVDSLVLADMDILLELDDSGRLILLDSLGIGAAGESKNNGRWKSWSVDLRGVHLDNCRAALSKKMGSASVLLEYLDLSFVRNEADGMIDLTLAFSDIHSEGLGPGLFRGKRFQLKLGIDVNNGVAVLNSGSLDVQDARITIAGQTALFPPYKADLILEARGADTDLLLSFLPEGVVLGEVIPEGNGEITVDGYLEGELFNRPDIKLDIVCSNFSLKHVPSGMVMDDIEFELFAFRQNRGPYSFGLRDLNLIFPDGAVHGDISLENPKEPLLMVDIEAGFDISTLSSFFVFPGSKTVQGILDLDVDVFGRFDRNGRLLVRERESGELLLSNFRYIIPGGKSGIQNMNLLLSLEDGYLNINSLDALTDFGEMSLSGSFGDIWPLILRGNGPVHCGLNFTSAVIQPGELFKDPLVAAKWGNELKDISLDLIFDSTAEALRKANPLPEGSYRIADFNVRIPDTGKNLRDFSGGIELSNGLMADLQGRFQDSDVSLEIGLDGYEYLFKGD
ncbi:MAG: hypothetical protein KAH21_11300, partial [Spirochaetaceae bacterium]|nr:hypothetical protein [Spirochaetaceae bacterium]